MKKEKAVIINEINSLDFEYIMNMWKNNNFHTSLNILGKGSYGVVYEYKEYAIKVFLNEDGVKNAKDPYILTQLNNNEFFPILYFYVENEFMVVEKINGVPINDLVFHTNIFPSEEWIYYLEKAFNLIIDNDLLPNDITASNVMLTENGFPVIIDVGEFEKLSEVDKKIKDTIISRNLLLINNQCEGLLAIRNKLMKTYT